MLIALLGYFTLRNNSKCLKSFESGAASKNCTPGGVPSTRSQLLPSSSEFSSDLLNAAEEPSSSRAWRVVPLQGAAQLWLAHLGFGAHAVQSPRAETSWPQLPRGGHRRTGGW